MGTYYIHTRVAFEVILQAIKDLTSDGGYRCNDNKNTYQDALCWITEKQKETPCISFNDACEVLGWDKASVRKEILAHHKVNMIKTLITRIRKAYRISNKAKKL